MIKRNFLSLGAVFGLAAIGLAVSGAPAQAVSLTRYVQVWCMKKN